MPQHEEMFYHVLDGNVQEAITVNDRVMDKVLARLTGAATTDRAGNNKKGAVQDETK